MQAVDEQKGWWILPRDPRDIIKDFRRDMSVGRTLRVSFGVGLFFLAAWVYVPKVFHNVSNSAIVNARVIPVVSPIEGEVIHALPIEGERLASGHVLTKIRNAALDRGRYQQLRVEAKAAHEQMLAVEAKRDDLEELRQALSAKLEDYRAATISRTRLLLREGKAAARAAEAEAREYTQAFERKSRLLERGVVSAAMADSAKNDADRAEAEAERSRISVERLEAELLALENNVFVTEERNDVPYTQQRIDEVDMRLIELRARAGELATRVTEIKKSIDVENERLARTGEAVILVPGDSIVWRSMVVEGSYVRPNSDLAMLIDCSALFVNAVVHERYFEDIRPGSAATVRIVGSDDTQTAIVRELRGMGVDDPKAQLAAGLPKIGRDEFVVSLEIAGGAKAGGAGEFCNVGRAAEVQFDRGFNIFSAGDTVAAEPGTPRRGYSRSYEAGAQAAHE